MADDRARIDPRRSTADTSSCIPSDWTDRPYSCHRCGKVVQRRIGTAASRRRHRSAPFPRTLGARTAAAKEVGLRANETSKCADRMYSGLPRRANQRLLSPLS